MPQEPWKRASQLKRAVPQGLRKPIQEVRARRHGPWPGLLALLVVLSLATIAVWYFWLNPGPVPQEVGEVVEQIIPRNDSEPTITAEELDNGLGIGLAIFGDYRELLNGTREKGIEWKMTAAGTSIRMSAPGLKVYVTDGTITAYTLNISELFSTEEWKWWQKHLGEVGITEEATLLDVTGQEGATGNRTTLTSSNSRKLAEGWGSPAYELTFNSDGVLSQLKGGIAYGVADSPGPAASSPADR